MASPLEGCVASLRNSMQLLDSSINILDHGVSDLPRLSKVLQTTRVRMLSLLHLPLLICRANTFRSTLNSSPNPIFKRRNRVSFQKFAQKSTIFSSA